MVKTDIRQDLYYYSVACKSKLNRSRVIDKGWVLLYQKQCRSYPGTINKIIKECQDAKQKRIQEEQTLGQV